MSLFKDKNFTEVFAGPAKSLALLFVIALLSWGATIIIEKLILAERFKDDVYVNLETVKKSINFELKDIILSTYNLEWDSIKDNAQRDTIVINIARLLSYSPKRLKLILENKNVSPDCYIDLALKINSFEQLPFGRIFSFSSPKYPYPAIITYFTIFFIILFSFIYIQNLRIKEYSLGEIPISLRKYLKKIFKNNVEVLDNIHNNYPVEFIENIHEDISPNDSGGLIVEFKCTKARYSKIAEKLLGRTNKSVYSTSYSPSFLANLLLYCPKDEIINLKNIFQTDEDFSMFREDCLRVQKWIDSVNQSSNNKNNFVIKRVQLIDRKDKWEELNSYDNILIKDEDKDKMKTILKSKILNNYQKEYLGILDNGQSIFDSAKFLCQIEKLPFNHNLDQYFFGEYIIFDEKMLLKYDFHFNFLQIFFGKNVGSFSSLINDYFNTINTNVGERWNDEKNKIS